MAGIDYSKWDHIEISDDEDDTHPNIDTPSLFRWRHKARIERDAEFTKEREDVENGYKNYVEKVQNIKDKIDNGKKKNEDVSKLVEELKKVETEGKEIVERKNDFSKREKKRPLNIDTICKEGKTKTIINKIDKPEEKDEDIVDRMKSFGDKYDKEIKKFGMFRKPEDSEKYLKSNPQLVCEDTANHLVIWCIDLAVQEKNELMKHVSHQCIVMQFILELAKSLKKDPRDCVNPFFIKFKSQEPEYQMAFESELDSFRGRIKERAEIRMKEALERYEEEERQKRLGPGGLDPVEVFESLPEKMKECFESKNLDLLQDVLKEMDAEQAEYHMSRCVASGMWVPDANKDTIDTKSGLQKELITEENDGEKDKDESIYDDARGDEDLKQSSE